jgi:hypothetical protein
MKKITLVGLSTASTTPVTEERKDSPMQARRIRRALTTAAVAMAGALTALPAVAAPPAGEISEPTWINGRVGAFQASFSAPWKTDVRETMFVVGPQDPANPQAAADEGAPEHDHVLAVIPYGQRARCHVWFVVVNDGPQADDAHTRPSGPDYEVDLAYEVDLGAGFVPLTSIKSVEAGLSAGILALADVGLPDFACWTEQHS